MAIPAAANTPPVGTTDQTKDQGLIGQAQPQTVQPPTTQVTTPVSSYTTKETDDTVAQGVAAPRPVSSQETVQGQLQGLLSSGSPYLQSATEYGRQQAAARGLGNSSVAIGAAQRSLIDKAAPIAAQDASTYAAAGLSAQNANQELTNTNAAIKGNLAMETMKEQQEKAMADVTTENQIKVNNAQAQSNLQVQTALKNIVSADTLAQMSVNDRNTFASTVGPIMQQYTTQVTAIEQIPDSQMSAADKQKAIQDAWAATDSQIKAMASLFNYNVKSSLSQPTANTYSGDNLHPKTPPVVSPPKAITQIVNGQNVTLTPNGNNYVGSNGVTYVPYTGATGGSLPFLRPTPITINGKQYVAQAPQWSEG